MQAYDRLSEQLEMRYRTLSAERDGAPVYAIEHGLDANAVQDMQSLVAGRIRILEGIGIGIAWPLVAFAAEIGYSYEGLFSGYWPRLEAALGLPLHGRAREALSEHHERACKAVGLARPDDTPFTRAFRHIAWPLANALAPRQIHGGLCAAILEAVTLDTADAALLRAVQQGCRRSGVQALIYWADGEERVNAVAAALLDATDVRLSHGIVKRLQHDMMTASNVRDVLVRARLERKRRHNLCTGPRTDASDAAVPTTKDDDESTVLPFEIRGGLRLAARSYALGLPVTLLAHDNLRVTHADAIGSGPDILAAGENMTLAPDGAAQIAVAYRDEDGARRSTSLRFDPAVPPPALATARTEPDNPTLADLRDGRLAILMTLSPPPDDLRAARWPVSLRDVDVQLELRVAGSRTLYARELLPTVPGRLTGGGSGLTTLADGLRRYEEEAGNTRAVNLVVRWGSGRRTIDLVDAEPAIRWHEGEAGWQATSLDLSEELTVRYVSAADPLAVPSLEPAGEGAHLHVVEGMTAPNLLVAGPRRLRVAHVASPSVIHRRFAASDASRGLSAEIEAWLGWRCARPIHAIAEMEARSAAGAAEHAILTTLCGPAWVEEEGRLPSVRPFALRLAEAAIALDLVKIVDLQHVGERIEKEDIADLAVALAHALTKCPDLLARLAELGEREAVELDANVDTAWRELTSSRARRALPPLDPDTANAPEAWREAWSRSLAARERHSLASMILPPRLAGALRDLDYATVETLEVARLLGTLRIDRGALARQARRLSGTDILSALSLWNNPRAFSTIDWRPLAIGLLEDRMTSRAIRYASLRMADERGGT